MSAVALKSKKVYLRALLFEGGCLFLGAVVTELFNQNGTLSFLFGALAGLIPHSVFVYWMFFRAFPTYTDKLRALYKGEALKWAVAIGLIGGILCVYPKIRIVFFLAGYFLLLLLNNLIPALLFARYERVKNS